MASPSLRQVQLVIIHCPADQETVGAVLAGDAAAIARDRVAGPILALIQASDVLGNFGRYRGVVEITAGFESFTPTADAHPAVGEAGSASLSPTIIFKTYAGDQVSSGELLDALAGVVAAHPWEVPVIEIRPTSLLVR